MKTLRSIFFLLLALPIFAAQQTINTGTNPNDGAGDSLRTAFTKVNANFTDLYNTAVFSNSIVQWSSLTNTPATLAGYGITNGITAATAASTYAPLASPTFTGTVTIPAGASIASPTITGTPTVPTASVDTSTTQASSTAFVLGQAASATPLINGTAAVGTSTRYARGDHVHPTDTSRAPLASPTFTGTVTIPSGASIAGYLTTNAAASTYASLSGPVFTNSLTLPNWSTANRPASPTAGMIGWNTDLARFDHYVGTNGWKDFVRLDGDTMTGLLVLSADPSAALGAATKQYVDVKAPLASPTFTGVPAVPTAAVDTSTTQAASTAFVLGQASSATPLIDGTAAVGTSTRYARGDHVHPTDTSRAPLASPTFTGTVTIPTGASITSPTINTAANFASTATLNWNSDTYLQRDAANIVAQRNGATAQGVRVYNTFTDASNYERAAMYWSGNALYIGSEKAGTGAARVVNIGSNPTGSPDNQLNVQGTTIRLYASANYVQIDSSSNINPAASTQTVGTSGAPWNGIFLSKTITAAGTTGAQTINKSSGSVNLAAAATSLVVTDSLVSTSSVIICTVGSNDTTCKSVQAVAGAGSFTIYPNAAPTAETRVNFLITN